MLILKCDVVIFFMMIDKEPQLSSFCKNKGKIQVCLRLTKGVSHLLFLKILEFLSNFQLLKKIVKMKGTWKKNNSKKNPNFLVTDDVCQKNEGDFKKFCNAYVACH